MSARRLPNESEIADALLAQALAAGHYVTTPTDEQCPSGVWMLVPLDRRLVQILDMAGAEHADLEPNGDLEPDHDGEPSLGSTDQRESQEDWSEGVTGRCVADQEQDDADDEPSAPGARNDGFLTYVHSALGEFRRL